MSKRDKNVLATRPRLLRGTIARGLASSSAPAIDPKGGDFGAGIIRGMAVITRGEALGHGMWCDGVMLAQIRDAINAGEGVKGRFTHPDLSGDGLGKYTGRVRDARLDGDVVRADLHLAASAHQTPDGDLAGYLMALAKEDPEAFGNSIAFYNDFVAEDKFRAEHSKADGEGYPEFQSPDPDNVHNYRHARVAELRAVDAVDEPAANPGGLFHRGAQLAAEAESLITFSLGLSTERPKLAALDVDPDRVGAFVQRVLARHNLTLSKKDPSMTTSELDASLAKQFASTISPATKTRLATRLEADKEDRDEDREKAGEEEGDADKDEEKDKGKKESGGDFGAKRGAQLAADDDETKLDDEDEKKKKEREDDEEKDEDTTGLAAKKLAKGGEAPKGDTAGDEGATQDEKQNTQKGVSEGSEDDAKEGTPVDSPSKKKEKGIGPMGDPSNNVGYKAAIAECKKFTAAFGPHGAVWFADGKSFAEAQTLFTAALSKENEDLKKKNAELATKAEKHRGLSKPLNAGGESTSVNPEQARLLQNVGGGGIGRFALAISADLAKLRHN